MAETPMTSEIREQIKKIKGKYYYMYNFCSCGNIKTRYSKKCQKCASIPENNPMFGVHRFNKDSPNYKEGKYSDNKKIYYCIEGCGKIVFEEGNRCMSCSKLKKNLSEKVLNAIKNSSLKRWKNKKFQIKMRKIYKKKWKNKEYREKQLSKIIGGSKNKPNKKEIILLNIINTLLPNEYKFVGDGQVILNRFCPDFINVNGQKKIIEFFGDFWHANPLKYKANDIMYRGLRAKDIWERNKKRLKIYKKLGYNTLIIWENELNDINKVRNNIEDFNKN